MFQIIFYSPASRHPAAVKTLPSTLPLYFIYVVQIKLIIIFTRGMQRSIYVCVNSHLQCGDPCCKPLYGFVNVTSRLPLRVSFLTLFLSRFVIM